MSASTQAWFPAPARRVALSQRSSSAARGILVGLGFSAIFWLLLIMVVVSLVR